MIGGPEPVLGWHVTATATVLATHLRPGRFGAVGLQNRQAGGDPARPSAPPHSGLRFGNPAGSRSLIDESAAGLRMEAVVDQLGERVAFPDLRS